MYDTRRRGFGGHSELLAPVALLSLAISIALPSCSRARYLSLLNQAQQIAVREYGDKKAPLTMEEKHQFYRDLGVQDPNRDALKYPDAAPTKAKLKEYIAKHKNLEGKL
jgi:hypothetical protein